MSFTNVSAAKLNALVKPKVEGASDPLQTETDNLYSHSNKQLFSSATDAE